MPNTVTMETLAEIVRPIVEMIEGQDALTQDRYDQYMVAIERISGRLGSRGGRLAAAELLIRAGAPARGVTSALKALGVEHDPL